MKIGQIKRTYSTPAVPTPMAGKAAGAPTTVTEDIEIPGGKILGFIFSAGGFAAITALVTVFAVDAPKTRHAIEQARAEAAAEQLTFQRDVLLTALALDDPKERAVSLDLFGHAGLLDTKVVEYAKTIEAVPHIPSEKSSKATPKKVVKTAEAGE